MGVVVSILLYGCTTWMLTKCIEKKTWRQLHKNAASCNEQILEATSRKAAVIQSPPSHLPKSDELDILGTVGEAKTNL